MIIKRNFDLFERFKEFSDTIGKLTLGYKVNGVWIRYSTKEYQEYSNYFSYGLLALNLTFGDKIATVINNRPEWNFINMGSAQVGVVHVPIFPHIGNSEMEHILSHSDSKLVFVAGRENMERVKKIAEKIPAILGVYCLDNVENEKKWTDIIDLGKENESKFIDKVEKIKSEVSENDVLNLIYTSGTTGLSKGVMLSHRNLMSNGITSAGIQHMNHNDRVLSFLPLSHVFENMCNYQYQYNGMSIFYAENVNKIVDNIKELQVNGFITVPRLLESIFERIMSIGNELKGIRRWIFNWAVELGFKYIPYKGNNIFYRIEHKIADKLVYTKWRDALNHHITFIGCGGASLQTRLAKLFWAAGLPVFEGYGLTETSPVIAVNYSKKGKVKLGTVGLPMKDIYVKIAPDGEILSKGPHIMLGYYKNPEQTKEVIDEDGWFHTGDIGSLDSDGFLTITDRKKEIFKLSNGKYVAPQMIENKMKESFFIAQAMIFGENKKSIGMLVSPNYTKLKEWCEHQKIYFKDNHELINTPNVIQHFQKEISKLNINLSQWEKVKKFKLVVDEWTHQTGELSPSLKLKRKVIFNKYKTLIEKMHEKP
jgi:long-chain acyl-CoA synthetase